MKMDTRSFFFFFFYGFLQWPLRGRQIGIHPFLGQLCGEWGWAISLLLFLGCPGCYFNSLPPSLESPQGAGNPIPSCRLYPEPGGEGGEGGGGAGSAQWKPAARILGQGSSSSLFRAVKHKWLSGRREQWRGTRHPETVCTVFFIRGWLNVQEIKTQKELSYHPAWTVCIQRCFEALAERYW